MPATKRNVLLSAVEYTGNTLEVLEAERVYTIVYNGRTINLRLLPKDYGIVRYRRTSFTTKGQANRVARNLNAFFETDLFTVVAHD